MSKESYIRGFCKAAEAAGVDPQALAKCAAGWLDRLSSMFSKSTAGKTTDNSAISKKNFNTGGWAPEGTPGPESGRIPFIPVNTLVPDKSSRGKVSTYIADNFSNPEKASDSPSFNEYLSDISKLKALSPRYDAFFNAHGESVRDVANRMHELFGSTFGGDLGQIKEPWATELAKLYHDKMLSRTGTVSRVSAPIPAPGLGLDKAETQPQK